jgi:hypothetical protein
MASIVTDAVSAAGGEITHNDLVANLEAAGNGAIVPHLLNLSQGGVLRTSVRATGPDQPAVLFYSLAE